MRLRALLHKHTTCRIGVHSPWGDWKYDGSLASLICRYCQKIVAHGYVFDVGSGVAYGCSPRGGGKVVARQFVSFVKHKQADEGSGGDDAENR